MSNTKQRTPRSAGAARDSSYDMNLQDKVLIKSIECFRNDFLNDEYNLKSIFSDLDVQRICTQMIQAISSGDFNSNLRLKWELCKEKFVKEIKILFPSKFIDIPVLILVGDHPRMRIKSKIEILTSNSFQKSFELLETLNLRGFSKSHLRQIFVSSSNKPHLKAEDIIFPDSIELEFKNWIDFIIKELTDVSESERIVLIKSCLANNWSVASISLLGFYRITSNAARIISINENKYIMENCVEKVLRTFESNREGNFSRTKEIVSNLLTLQSKCLDEIRVKGLEDPLFELRVARNIQLISFLMSITEKLKGSVTAEEGLKLFDSAIRHMKNAIHSLEILMHSLKKSRNSNKDESDI